ncbi:MAG: signal peptide peptidase SppA [Zetaproteobacteria bacterium]|nr:MAG: signal peptide peptidase SppA [Zetaproteobacteria bacterium]
MNKDPWSKRKNLYSSSVPKAVKEPKVKWRLLPILWMALKKTCMLIGATVLCLIILSSWVVSTVVDEIGGAQLPEQMVLYMELDGEIGDLPGGGSLAGHFGKNIKTMKTFVDAIEQAKTDPRVEGIYAQMKPGNYSVAHIEEIRTAIKSFRQSGKFTYIYAPSYNNGLSGYYLASSFDEIWMQPMGNLMITGIGAEMPFLRNVLDKIGIEPQFFQRKEYKSAYESLTNSEMSEANRRATQALITDIYDVLSKDIARDRDISVAAFNSFVDRGMLLADEAYDVGLIDKVDYADQLIEHISIKVTGEPKSDDLIYINFDTYMKGIAGQGHPKGDDTAYRVALIYAVGAIMDGNGNKSRGVAAADEISGALLRAAYDDSIDAVVLRVDSPGGSPVASETILRAVEKVQEEGKTVTVSMGSVAASGGYWISAYADEIFVLPTTITGSIGVLGGKVSAQEMWKTLGVNWERISQGRNAAMFSLNTPFSQSEAARMNMMLDNIYDGFIERVAKGRNMSVEQVDKIARGRVWVGTSAVEIGIADQFGGLNEALDYAAVQAGATDRHDVDVVIFPKPLSPIEKFVELLEGQVQAGQVMGIQAAFLREIQPVISEFMIMQNSHINSVYAPVHIQ